MLLSITLPAGAATSEQLLSIRQQLKQAGVLATKSTNEANSIKPAINASLDCQELRPEPVAAVLFPPSPVRSRVAASVGDENNSGLFGSDALQTIPA
jgi:hypothetical protein